MSFLKAKRIIRLSALTVTASSVGNSLQANDDNAQNIKSYYPAVIVGAGWAGLGVSAALSTNNVDDYLVLERGNRVGYFWYQLFDNVMMNTFQHRLWHSPSSCEPKEIQDYRDKAGVLDYLSRYSSHFGIDQHIRFNSEVQRIDRDESTNEWILTLNDDRQIRTDILTVATSINRCPHIPKFKAMETFQGQLLHTFDYKNASQFDDIPKQKKKFLVIGCGNSAIEIAGELKLHDMDNHEVTLLVRNGRHFTKGKTKHRFESTLDRICSPSPFSEESIINDNMVSCNDLSFHLDIIDFDAFTDWMIFVNMTKYGIPKPALSPTADHYYNKKLTIVDRNTIPLIQKKKIEVINGEIDHFTEHGIVLKDGMEKEFDVVLLGTGYHHGLDQMFESSLWERVSTTDFGYPDGLMEICKEKKVELPTNRKYAWPNLNGRSRSKVYDNLYFAGFDQGYLGGGTIGIYSWAVGEEIAVKLKKMSVEQCTIPWIQKETILG